MDRGLQDETDLTLGPPSPAHYKNGLPTPLTPTVPKFANSVSDDTPTPSPMTGEFTPDKAKGKRSAEDMDVDNDGSPAVAVPVPKPLLRITAPKLTRRHRHRRRNVAATVWGPCLPGSTAPQPFNVYKAILRHPNLFFQFAIRLPVASIVDLYAIDKEFHYRFNKYSTSIIHDFASYHAYHAAYIFSWILFPELCISDPMLRPMDGRPHLARDIPSLRWTKMVIYRDNVVRGILTCLGLDGHRVPRAMHIVLMKFWLLMEMRTTILRKAFLATTEVWSNTDIYLFHLFLVKLDMLFNHPVFSQGYTALSHMLLTQKSLTTLYKLLNAKKKMDYEDAEDVMLRTYLSDDLDTDAHPWLDDEMENGVPQEQWGLLCREDWELDGERMEPAVDMLITEGVRRGLDAQQYLVDFMVYGFVDRDTQQNIPAPRKWRGDKKIHVPKEAWPTESSRRGTIANLDKKFAMEGKKEGGMRMVAIRTVSGMVTGIRAYDPKPKQVRKPELPEKEGQDQLAGVQMDGVQQG